MMDPWAVPALISPWAGSSLSESRDYWRGWLPFGAGLNQDEALGAVGDVLAARFAELSDERRVAFIDGAN